MPNKNNVSILGYEEPKLYSNNAWMVTFADLISLLLVFFILMYSTSSVEGGRWQKVIDSLSVQFHTDKALNDGMFNTNFSASKVQILRGMDLDYLYTVLSNKISADESLTDKIVLNNEGGNLIISLKNEYIFDGKTPILTEDSKVALFTIGESLQKVNNKIEIVGYIEKNGNKSLSKEWDLSLERSVALAGEFRKYGNLSTLEATIREDNKANGKVDIIIYEFIK
jgi:chemotaxis protein MotB